MALTNPGTVIIDRTTSMVIEGVYEFDRVDGGTLVAPSGPSFPDPAVAGEFFWRSDLSKLYRRNDANDAWEAQEALTNPMTTKGDIIFGATDGAPNRLGGVTGSYLRSGGIAADPTFTRYLDVDSLIASASIGASPDTTALLQVDSTTKGVLISRMTLAQRDAIVSPATGLLVYLTDSKLFSYYDGVSWRTNGPLSDTAPVNVTKSAAAVGVGSTAARADHKHDISTGVASSQVPGDSAAEGSSTSLARSDHKHGLPAFGTASGTFCQGNDARLSDARTPTAHAASHKSGGSDFIRLDEFAACTDNTNLNATTSAHGLLPKLGGGTTNFLRADGTWAPPVFGTEFSQASSDSESTTTSTSFQQKLRLTTASLPSGTYRIGWFYEWGMSSLTDFRSQVQINDATTCMEGFEEAVDAGADQYFPRGGHYYHTGSGVLNIDLDYCQNGGGTARIRRARLEIWRVS